MRRAAAFSIALMMGFAGMTAFFLNTKAASQPKPEQEGVFLPILMYHSVLKDQNRAGKFVVSPETLEADMKFLKDRGYQTVVVQDLLHYVNEGTALPEKPVMLTFDDGYYNNYTYVYPLLQKYEYKAVISVVGSYSETFSQSQDLNPNYAHLTWDVIKELSESGFVEIQNHTYDMHKQSPRKGSTKIRGECLADYETCLTQDVMKLQTALKEKSGVKATAFTYPYGQISKESLDIVKKMGFQASLTCYEKPNFITQDPQCLYQLNRYNRAASYSTEKIMKKIGIE